MTTTKGSLLPLSFLCSAALGLGLAASSSGVIVALYLIECIALATLFTLLWQQLCSMAGWRSYISKAAVIASPWVFLFATLWALSVFSHLRV